MNIYIKSAFVIFLSLFLSQNAQASHTNWYCLDTAGGQPCATNDYVQACADTYCDTTCKRNSCAGWGYGHTSPSFGWAWPNEPENWPYLTCSSPSEEQILCYCYGCIYGSEQTTKIKKPNKKENQNKKTEKNTEQLQKQNK
jgi:hypothetical protein